jgi:hypothetical protein
MTCEDAILQTRRVSAHTIRAYRKTRYEVAGVAIRIGRRSPAMDRLLAARGARQAALITAYNPFSRIMPPGWNRRMQVRLVEAMRRRPSHPASGSWRRWAEGQLLIFGDIRPAARLMRIFRQNAIVIVRRGQPARLLLGL